MTPLTVFQAAVEIPGYSCEALIGRGGMGSVYRATQLAHSRPVAVKVLGEAFRGDPEFVARFRREAELLASLEHPHIVPMLESGEAGGVPYIVMRLIDGPNLRELVRLHTLEPLAAVAILQDAAEAIDFAHSRGVLHRDIKPHNMLLDHGGHVWLADFGLTKLALDPQGMTATSHIAGTFDYLAPEVAAGHPASVASDTYALAITAFQLLTGRLPFEPGHAAGTLTAHASAQRPSASAFNLELLPAVDSVLADGMAIDPEARPASAGAFVEQLNQALRGPAWEPRPRWLSLVSAPPPELATAPRTAASGVTSAETDLPRPGTTERSQSAIDAAPPQVEPAPTATGTELRSRPRPSRRRWGAIAAFGAAAVIAAVVAAVALLSSPGRAQAAQPVALTAIDQAVPTHYDYIPGHGNSGPALPAGRRVSVSCRASADGQWYYRIASVPWDLQYYAPAKDFHNGGGQLFDPKVAVCSYYEEVSGNRLPSNTWSNYTIGGGKTGKLLPGLKPVEILCRVRGLKVNDGNVWWYRVGGSPWDGHYYISADAFYNNGKTKGSLKGTKFVDLDVPLC